MRLGGLGAQGGNITCLFMRLHFSIGGDVYRRTTRFRQSVHFSIAQVLFADHVH